MAGHESLGPQAQDDWGKAASPSCRSWWSAYTHASADFHQAPPEPPSCREFWRVARTCTVEKAETSGREMLHCHETREKFRICKGSLTDRTDRLTASSIETREPWLGETTFVPTRTWEHVPPAPESTEAKLLLEPSLQRRDHQDALVESRRHYRPWQHHADEGHVPSAAGEAQAADEDSSASASCPPQGCESVLLHPKVGKAVDEIFTFADEMQRDLEKNGMKLVQRGEAAMQRRGLLSWFFGRGGGDDAKSG